MTFVVRMLCLPLDQPAFWALGRNCRGDKLKGGTELQIDRSQKKRNLKFQGRGRIRVFSMERLVVETNGNNTIVP